MSEPRVNRICKTKIKFDVLALMIFVMVVIPNRRTNCDPVCEAISVDAITQLHNGSIAIFDQKDVWFLDLGKEQNQIMGPCPISSVYKGMTGPLDAAITITAHDMITDFIGASIYFEDQKFFTFKNLGPYQAEWGTIIYVPVKGEQRDIGQGDPDSPETNEYMKRTISYAFYDPKDNKSKFVFADATSLAFSFDMGVTFDTPIVSTIDEELGKYGVDYVPKTLTAALTLTKDDTSQLYLFESNTYCAVKLDESADKQSCRLKPIKDFFKCQSISRTNDFCSSPNDVVTSTHDTPVQARNRPEIASKPNKNEVIDQTPVTDSKVETRSQNNATETKTNQNNGSNGCMVGMCLSIGLTISFDLFISHLIPQFYVY